MSNKLTKGKALVGAIDVPSNYLFINGTAVTATATELNRVADVSGRVINGTAAGTLTLTEATHDSTTVLLNRAAGFTVALPAATGSGMRIKFVVAATGTANYVIRAGASDAFWGNAFFVTDNAGAGTSVWGFKATGGTVITLSGSTTAGIKGDVINLEDVLTNIWQVDMRAAGTGAEATPFS
jgi:hypothetical protein